MQKIVVHEEGERVVIKVDDIDYIEPYCRGYGGYRCLIHLYEDDWDYYADEPYDLVRFWLSEE